ANTACSGASYRRVSVISLDLFLAAMRSPGLCLQIGAETVKLFFPCGAVLFHPSGCFAQWFAIQAAGPPLRVATLADEAGLLEHLQVLGHGRQAHLPEEGLREVRDIRFAFGKARQH